MNPITQSDRSAEQGPIAGVGPNDIIAALGLASTGRVYDLEVERFRRMPIHPVHPAMEVLTYRTPGGLQNQRDQGFLLGDVNRANSAWISDMVMATSHSGTHIDALSHITTGEDNHWFGCTPAGPNLGDNGPLTHDGSSIPPIITRGVLLDIAGHQGVDVLAPSQGISADDLKAVAAAQGVTVQAKDTVLVRTGYTSHWPDEEAMAKHYGCGIDASAAQWLVDEGVVCVVGDTEALERVPSLDPHNPYSVHTILLIENGVYIVEMADLSRLAADKVYEFLFLALPLKIRGTTGSMIRPIAIV
jgi:kynurenine formamidase